MNSEQGVLGAWRVENRTRIAKGTTLAEVETSKALIDVDAPDDGFLLQIARDGETIALSIPIAYVFEDVEALENFAAELARKHDEEAASERAAGSVRATKQARRRAEELRVDLRTLDISRLITVKEVEAAAVSTVPDYGAPLEPLPSAPGIERLLLIGGAFGAMQVLDILQGYPTRRAVAIVDDDRSKWGREVYGVPVIGGTDRLGELFTAGAFEAAIITIGTSIPVRLKFRQACSERGIPLANAIDCTAKLASEVKIGTGNIICAFCHFGASTVIGDNNFFSAFGSFDHHNVLGSDITTGPSCVTSGLVRIGNRVRMGMGVLIEPNVEIGDGAQIASGAIIFRSVPADYAVKTKVITTAIVPIRGT